MSTFFADGYSDFIKGIYSPPDVPVYAVEYTQGWNTASDDQNTQQKQVFSVKATLKELRYDMIDRPDPNLNYSKALELVLEYLEQESIDFSYHSQYQ